MSQAPKPPIKQPTKKSPARIGLAAVFVVLFLTALYAMRQYLTFENLAASELHIKQLYAENMFLTLAIAFLIYATVTGLSLPGALFMSLVYAWFFGFWPAVVLISFASTTGATIAFLFSRYLFRNWFESRFSRSLVKFNDALEKEGAFYLFTLRLIPAVPFFVINAVMGLTKMKVTTFWWVSQIGMLAGTSVFVYAGSGIPNLQALQEHGAGAVFTAAQLTQITIALALLGLFPITAKKIIEWVKPKMKTETENGRAVGNVAKVDQTKTNADDNHEKNETHER